MPKVEESNCCNEVKAVMAKMEEENLEGCITTHPGFQSVCLDRWVLQTAYLHYKQDYGHMAATQTNE